MDNEKSRFFQIVREELELAEARIVERLSAGCIADTVATAQVETISKVTKPLPANENYSTALSNYRSGETHSGIAQKLGVSINAVKKYYNRLVKYGYLPIEAAKLSDMEQKVVDCIFLKKMSLSETANVSLLNQQRIVPPR